MKTAVLHTVAGPYQTVRRKRELNSFTASLRLQQPVKCSCTIMKTATLHIVAGPYQAVWRKQELNSFTASLHLQQTVKCSYIATKIV
jgi:hypothetical protein